MRRGRHWHVVEDLELVDPLHGALLDVLFGLFGRAVVTQPDVAALRHLLRREPSEAAAHPMWLLVLLSW
jgi:beta-lactamase regulating signal transducer with metallopeptidase domain